ncbi:MAG: hypothetical protein M3401_11980, partial [Actinomycetota bacterium]|nr:hypothetical protein [Actinomycetota bacterium]
GVERQQLLWLTYGALLIPATLVNCGVENTMTGDVTWITGAAAAVMELAVPISIAVAVLRYGLFDIELIINRTLVYGVLTACVVAIYVAVVGGLSSVLDSRGLLGLIAHRHRGDRDPAAAPAGAKARRPIDLRRP